MRTVVFADLHLSTANRGDKAELVPWMARVLDEERPDRLMLAGDIFELILSVDHISVNTIGHARTRMLALIIGSWPELFALWNASSVQEFVFLAGEHDYDIVRPEFLAILQDALPGKVVTA